MSLERLLSTCEERSTLLIVSMKMANGIRKTPETQAAYDKVLEEVDTRTMTGPMCMGDLVAKHGRFFNLTRRFWKPARRQRKWRSKVQSH